MVAEMEPRALASLVGPPVLIAIAALMVFALPTEVLMILLAWSVMSFPIGMLIGHCVLSENQHPDHGLPGC